MRRWRKRVRRGKERRRNEEERGSSEESGRGRWKMRSVGLGGWRIREGVWEVGEGGG